ncbi:MAG: heme-binding protein, partial [Leptospiraceae bacterium]|nr:heme-binding protein [Leptospiraceae bacterium]
MEYGSNINLDTAKKILSAAQTEAFKRGFTMAIAVVDTAGNLVAFEKMDNTQIGSVEIARIKAETSVRFKRSSKAFEESVAGGGMGVKVLSMPGVISVEGGELIVQDNKIIGA